MLNTDILKQNKLPLLLAFLSVLFYFAFAYNLIRTNYIKLITLYTTLFFVFYKLVLLLKTHIVFLTWLAFAFRTVFILAIPNLSQDFYRFIWDGRMILEGFNPYLYTVESFIKNGNFPVAQAQELYKGMGELNASHFTNYPPINQLCFIFAALFASKSILGSVIVMRLLIIAADFGILHFGKKLLKKLKIPVYNIFWYILNPFIIIELTGNLHFEGVMIFFLIWSLYILHIEKWYFASIVLGLSISVKLVPLIFLPLFFRWFTKQNVIKNEMNQSVSVEKTASVLPSSNDKKKWIPAFTGMPNLLIFYSLTGLTILFLFTPFYSKILINNYIKTIALWFQDFEFNASLYYIAREVGYLFRGYNEILIIGKAIPALVILFVLIITFFKKNKSTADLITSMLFVLSFYYFIATTIHPWYVATLLILSIFTNYKFPLVWSFAIILSYLAYLNSNNTETLWVIGFEYLIVYSVFIWEVFINKKAMKSIS